jgi:hypothetical protein
MQEFAGPGPVTPDSLDSDGEVHLRLGPWSAVVLRLTDRT